MTKTAKSLTGVPAVVDALVSAGLVEAGRRDEAQRVVSGILGVSGGAGVVPVPRVASEPVTVRPSSRGLLVEIAGYVGGALVLAAMGLFLAQQWRNISEAGQVATLAGITVALAVVTTVVARVGSGYAALRAGRDEVRRRLTAALATATALGAAITVGRQVSILDEDFTSWPQLLGALTMLVLGALAYALVSSALGQVAMVGAIFMATVSGLDLVYDGDVSALAMGSILLGAGLLWLVAAESGIFREQVVARALGSALTLFGAQTVLFDGEHNNVAYALMAAVAVAGFLMYMRTVAWPYLVVGVLGVTLVVPEAIIDWTEGALGPAGAVLVVGLTLLGASAAGFRARKDAQD